MDAMYKKVGIASMIMMASIFLSRVIGVFREMAVAYVGGADAPVDAYQVAFIIPEILNHVVASGFLSVTFIPIFTHHLSRNQEDQGWEIFSIIWTSFGFGLIILITAACLWADPLISILAPGITTPASKALAVKMTRIIMPAQFFFFSGGLLMAVQFAKERFLIPALAPLIYNLGIITGGLLCAESLGMEGFAWGVLTGAFVGNFALQYWGASRIGMSLNLSLHLNHPEFINYLRLTLPLIVGLTMMFSTEIFFKFFGSYLPAGGIAGLNYGLRVMLMLVALFGQAVGVASFPYMAQLVAQKRFDDLNRLINDTLRYMTVVIPFSVLLIVLRKEVVLILFQRGRFDPAATALTSDALLFLLAGAFAFAAQAVVVRGFYATQNTLLPAVYGSLGVIISVPAYVAGLYFWGINGVATAISLSVLIQVSILYAVWNHRSGNRDSLGVYHCFLRMLLVSVLMGALLRVFKNALAKGLNSASFSGALATCMLTGTLFVILLVAGAYIFDVQEVKHVLRRLGFPGGDRGRR